MPGQEISPFFRFFFNKRLRLLKKLLLAVIIFASAAVAQPVPKPHGGGDYWIYNEDTWLDWEVISAELNGRLTPSWPADEQAPGALLKIDWLVPQWPVVAKFSKGQRLHAVPDEGGGILIKDIDGGSWMKVQTNQGTFCFVRANSKYIKPVKAQPQVATPPPQPVVPRETVPITPVDPAKPAAPVQPIGIPTPR